jgi:pyruvate kinase
VTRRTKIVATIGPASDDPVVLAHLLATGVDVVRLNLSHGTIADHLAVMATVRAESERTGRPVGILADLPGPKIRAGPFPTDGAELVPGSRCTLVAGDGPSSHDRITVDYPTLVAEIEPGNRVAIGDGGISLRAVAVSGGRVEAVVESGGRTQGRPGVHVAGERLQLFAPTPRDLELAEGVAAAGVDFIALSFVRRAADVRTLRAVVGERAGIVAKIETSAALADLDAIVDVSDAIMVARGDLGIDCPIEDVPHLQKLILRRCVEVGRPVITATQMLESMIESPVPTRAEVSDVANAVFDGTDAVMLSGETAIGRDPATVVATMARIAERAEDESSYRRWAERLGRRQQVQVDDAVDRITGSITHAAWQAAIDAGVTAILCCTRSGRTARAMARYRPAARLVGISPDPRTVSRLTLSWGIDPIRVEEYTTSDEMVWFAVESALAHELIDHGDVVAVLAGAPDRHSGAATDVLRIVRVE